MRLTALTCAALVSLGGAVTSASAETVAIEVTSLAGPPAICVPVDCGKADTLPWGKGAFGKSNGLDAGVILKTTHALLHDTESTLAHMENLRRATIYLDGDTEAQLQLLARLVARAADAEADDLPARDRALAWFDAGFFAACLDQMGAKIAWAPGQGEGVWGYGWLERAAEADMSDPAIRFAMALASHPGMRQSQRDLWELHMGAAIKGSERDPLLRKNIEAHLAHWNERVSDFTG